jgi:tetratricopeptide (TPR) repeat protein
MYDFEEKIKKAYNLHTNGYFNEAETIYSELLVKDKKNITIIYLLGLTYFQQKRYNKAYKLIKIAAKKRPYSGECFYNLSLTCLKLGKINKALSYAEKSTKLNPLSAKAFNIYAQCLKNTEQEEEAILSYQKALNLDSSLYEEVIINQGMILIDLKKYE